MKPLCIEMFAGLHGWGEGFIAEGYRVVGFDIVDMCAELGRPRPDGIELVLQDVLTLHGAQFRDAAVIVASPPCQAYSYRAMPWKRAKALPPPSNELFDACFRIQREACAAAGRYIPLVVENVKGAQPWVGRAAWHYGSFYLWGDVPALMPMASGRKSTVGSWDTSRQNYTPDHSWEPAVKNSSTAGDSWFNVAHGKRIPGNQTGSPQRGDGMKVAMNFHEHEKTGKPGRSFQSVAVEESRGTNRKAASAMIAKIPFPMAQYIAQVYKPCVGAACV